MSRRTGARIWTAFLVAASVVTLLLLLVTLRRMA